MIIELFTFTYKYRQKTVRVTSNTAIYNDGIYDYQPAVIKRDTITTSPDKDQSDLSLTVDADFEVLRDLLFHPFSDQIIVTVVQIRGDKAYHLYRGFVEGGNLGLNMEGSIVLRSELTYLSRRGTKYYFSDQCGHILYSDNCKVSYSDYVVTDCEVISREMREEGLVVEVSSVGSYSGEDNDLQWGTILVLKNSLRISIFEQLNTKLTVGSEYVEFLEEGEKIRLSPGCNLTEIQCQRRFNNLANFGGFNTSELEETPYEAGVLKITESK